MKYNVHVYEVVRVKVVDVEAESQVDAIKIAVDSYDPKNLFDCIQARPPIEEIEWAEETSEYLVDEVGDTEFQNSRWYNASMERKP